MKTERFFDANGRPPNTSGSTKQRVAAISSQLDVGRLVADSIESEQFYVLPHPTWLNVVENRMKRVLEQEDPIGVQPEGGRGIELPQASD